MKTYTVKAPPQWARINSDRAQNDLRDYFIRPLALPADPGAGEQVLRLTLNERQVDALSRGSGDVPAVALRRLLAAHIWELPAAPSPEAITSIRPRKAAARAQTGPFVRPAWYTDVAAWGRLDLYAQQQMSAMNPGGERRGLVEKKPTRRPWFARLLADPFTLLILIVVVILILVAWSAGQSQRGSTAPAGPKYPQWGPV